MCHFNYNKDEFTTEELFLRWYYFQNWEALLKDGELAPEKEFWDYFFKIHDWLKKIPIGRPIELKPNKCSLKWLMCALGCFATMDDNAIEYSFGRDYTHVRRCHYHKGR